MAQKKLKVIPIYRFFQIMDRPNQVVFLGLFLVLAGLCVGTVIAVDNPVRWSMDIVEVPAQTSEEVTLAEYKANYRTQEATVEAWHEDMVFASRMISPREWMVWLFVASQVLGWGAFLAAATYIRDYYVYGAFFLFALFLLSSRMFESILPGTDWALGLGALLLITAPAFLIQQGYIKLKFLPRLAIFTALVAAPFALLYQFGGWEAVHRSTAEMLRMALFFAAIFIFFIATEPNNLLFFFTTNAKKKKYRASLPIISGIFLVLIGLQFMMLQDAMDWGFVEIPDDFPFRPMHLIALSALVMVGTKQNLYPKLKDFLPNRGMSFGFLGIGLIGMGIFFYHSLLGEYMFIRNFERIAIIVFFLTSLFHFFYINFNFGALIRARLNFYYITMLPRRLMFFFVIIGTFMVGAALEASKGFGSRKGLSSTLYNRLGDASMVDGDTDEAIGYYKAAVGVAEGNPKGNFNLGLLAWTVNEAPFAAREYFQKAFQYYKLPFSYINLAQMEMGEGLLGQAKYFLKMGAAELEDPYIYNNLAEVYLLEKQPDSAIIYMKKALALKPDESALYGNLGSIYMQYGRYGEAEEFYRAGLETGDPSPMTVTNALYLNLSQGTEIPVTDSLVRLEGVREHLPAWFNLAIDRFRKQDYAGARSVIDSLEVQLDRSLPDSLQGAYRPPEVLFLDGAIMFHEGKVANAISRMQGLDAEYPQMQRFTQRFLAAAYHGEGVPEMAAEFYRKSIENGVASDRLNEAYMEIDRGNHDYAFKLLSALQVTDSTLFTLVNKEISMLQYAHGAYLMASVGFDLSTLSTEEWIRVGLYAGASNNQPSALEAFRKVVLRDSSSIAPYLEMGRISLRYGDSLARENLQPGLDLQPGNLDLQVEMARALLAEGNLKAAREFYGKAAAQAPQQVKVQHLEAQIALADKDTAKALFILDTLSKQHPLNVAVIQDLSRVLRAQYKAFDINALLINARDLNSRNSEIEYELAYGEKLLGRIFESAEAAKRAIALSPDSSRREQIRQEFQGVFDADERGDEGLYFMDEEIYDSE